MILNPVNIVKSVFCVSKIDYLIVIGFVGFAHSDAKSDRAGDTEDQEADRRKSRDGFSVPRWCPRSLCWILQNPGRLRVVVFSRKTAQAYGIKHPEGSTGWRESPNQLEKDFSRSLRYNPIYPKNIYNLYITNFECFSASSLGWNIPKFHAIRHVPRLLIMFGCWENVSTNVNTILNNLMQVNESVFVCFFLTTF
jgi:hypothetical protein